MDASADLLKVNHRLESRVPEIGLLGSEGGATSSVVPTPIVDGWKLLPVTYWQTSSRICAKTKIVGALAAGYAFWTPPTFMEPGSTGSDWRIHYSLRLPEMCCDFFELTDYHGAESLRRLPVEPGDLVLVDRGYNDRKAVGQILECGGELIMRYNSGAFPLLNSAGQPLDPLKELRPLKIGEVGEWEVRFVSHKGQEVCARLCALRKSPEQSRRARIKAKRKAERNQVQIRPETLEYADFVVLLSTLNSQEMKLPVVLEFYRARWQVELAFKRLK